MWHKLKRTSDPLAVRNPVWELVALALLVSVAAAPTALTPVTYVGFRVEPGVQEIFVYWETSNEVDNLGFYIWRSEKADAGYEKLPLNDPEAQFIPSEDVGLGAFYDYLDAEVVPGVVYYYKVQDVPTDGSPGAFSAVESASLPEPKPDLEVGRIRSHPNRSGFWQTRQITVTIANTGNGHVLDDFYVDIYQDHRPTSCAEFGWTYATVPRLLAGETYTASFTHRGFEEPNIHTLYAQVDAGCRIDERREDNNISDPVILDLQGTRLLLPLLIKGLEAH